MVHKQNPNRLKWAKTNALIGTLLVSCSTAAQTNLDLEVVLDRAVLAYGGKQLMALKSLQLDEEVHRYGEAQTGYTAEGSHGIQLSYQIQRLSIDFEQQTKVFKQSDTRRVGNHGSDNMVVLDRRFGDGKGYSIDHCLARYHTPKWLNWQTVDKGLAQTVDTLLVKQLVNNKESLSLLSSLYIQGEHHEVLEFKQSNSTTSVYINSNTGLVSRMLKKQGEQTTRYDFLAHKQQQGIAWASEILVSLDTHTLSHTQSRQLAFNLNKALFSKVPSSYRQFQPERFLDFPEPSVNELAKGVYLVGQGWGFTLFIDVGAHYVSVGAWQMPNDTFTWQQRLDLLQQTTGNNKPVKEFIVTHHHDDHLMGLNEVVEHGAKLLMLPDHLDAVQNGLAKPLVEKSLQILSGPQTLAGRKIQIFDVPSSHAEHNLVVYLPEQKILFAEDMYGSSLAHGFHSPNSWPTRDVYYRTRKLNEFIQRVGFDVQIYASSHHGRIFSQADIDSASSLSCPDNATLQQRLFADNSK